jgi:hypothetical protein
VVETGTDQEHDEILVDPGHHSSSRKFWQRVSPAGLGGGERIVSATREAHAMTRRSRLTAFGSAGALVIAGIVCAVTIGGDVGPIAAFILIGLGLVLATSLAFLEVGLSEDRDRARDVKPRPRGIARRRPRPRLDRSRSHRRRLK